MDDLAIYGSILSCLHNGQKFEENYLKVLSTLETDNQDILDSFLNHLQEVLLSSSTTPTAKFYAQLLLLKASERDNKLLMRRAAKNNTLLDKLFKDCQFDYKKSADSKGRKFFSKSPTEEESVIGNNYINLLVESFKYWGDNYKVGDQKTSLKMYEVIIDNLKERMTFPTVFAYPGHTVFPEKFHLIPHKILVFYKQKIDPQESEAELKFMEEQKIENEEIFNTQVALKSSGLEDDSDSEEHEDTVVEKVSPPPYLKSVIGRDLRSSLFSVDLSTPKDQNSFRKVGFRAHSHTQSQAFAPYLRTQSEMHTENNEHTQDYSHKWKESFSKLIQKGEKDLKDLKKTFYNLEIQTDPKPKIKEFLYSKKIIEGYSSLVYCFAYAFHKSLEEKVLLGIRKLLAFYALTKQLINPDFEPTEYAELLEKDKIYLGPRELEILSKHYRCEAFVVEGNSDMKSMKTIHISEFDSRIYLLYDKESRIYRLVYQSDEENAKGFRKAVFNSLDDDSRDQFIKKFLAQD